MLESFDVGLVLVGALSGTGGLAGAMIGNRINVQWLKEGIAALVLRVDALEKIVQAHRIEIEIQKAERAREFHQ